MIGELILDDESMMSLKPEIESGNIEYKLRLDTKNDISVSKTQTQLKWRLSEGKKICGRYEAIYVFGIMDNGSFPSDSETLSEKNMNNTIDVFNKVFSGVNCRIESNNKYIFYKNKIIYLVKVVMDIDSGDRITETNVILLGPTEVGKTSLLSQLTHDQEDNGKGYSRKLSLKHEHERREGRTSDIKREFIGFKDNLLINYFTGLGSDMEDIYSISDRYVTIDDLPGDMKYIRTIIYGILSSKHDVIVICVPGKNISDVLEINKKQYNDIIRICKLYKKNPLILLTKIDLISHDELTNAVLLLKDFFSTFDFNDIVHTNKVNIDESSICIDLSKVNIISISNIDMSGLDYLSKYLSDYSKTVKVNLIEEYSRDVLFITNEIFKIPSVGNVLYGYIKYGNICVGDYINIFCGGKIAKRKVKSIHKKMVESKNIGQGETGCIQFYNLNSRDVDKTAVVISDSMKKYITSEVIFITSDEMPPKKSYLMFNGSTIQTVDLFYDKNEDESCAIKFRATNKTNLFIHPNSVTVLKDEAHLTYVGVSIYEEN